MFFAVAHVINVDFIQSIWIHLEVIRPAIRSLQRLVVGQQRYIISTSAVAVGINAFIAAKHVEIGAVDFGAGGDERGLAVA